MATIKMCTDIPQSKVLAKILPLESADMLFQLGEDKYADSIRVPLTKKHWEQMMPNINPCWSLAALLSVLPILERKGYQKAKPRLSYNVAINKWIVDSHVYTTDAYDNPVDACVAMIEKLHELKML